jgi:hypothetical protein
LKNYLLCNISCSAAIEGRDLSNKTLLLATERPRRRSKEDYEARESFPMHQE